MNTVLICSPSSSLHGGVENIIKDLCNELPARGWKATLALGRGTCFNNVDAYRKEYPDLPIIEIDGTGGTRDSRLESLTNVITRERPDIDSVCSRYMSREDLRFKYFPVDTRGLRPHMTETRRRDRGSCTRRTTATSRAPTRCLMPPGASRWPASSSSSRWSSRSRGARRRRCTPCRSCGRELARPGARPPSVTNPSRRWPRCGRNSTDTHHFSRERKPRSFTEDPANGDFWPVPVDDLLPEINAALEHLATAARSELAVLS